MEKLNVRADQADDLLKKLLERVNALESNKSCGTVGVGIHKEVKQKVRTEVLALRAELQKAHNENKALAAENQKLKKSAKAGGVSSEFKKKTDQNWDKAMGKAQKLRGLVQGLEAENEALKSQIEGLKNSSQSSGVSIKTDKLTQEQLEWLKNKMNKVRGDMIEYMNKKDSLVAEVKPAAACAGGLIKMTMETIKDLKYYTVTTDLDELRSERIECELGELDDEDLVPYLGRKVRCIEIEEDDDTINVRFDNHDSQWFPVGCLYMMDVSAVLKKDPAKAVAVPAKSSGLQKQSMDTIKERKTYFITKDLVELKKDWYEAELGELDDEDFVKYLGREVKTIDIEEDDETVNVRFDNHDSQWFPVTCLFEKVEGAAVVEKPKAVATPALEKMTLETFKERKKYTITTDLAMLKKEWYEAELGELDDEDFMLYLGRLVYAFDTEEDDETANVRFDNHDSQWFPIGCLYRPCQGAAVSKNGDKKKQSMDSIKERKTYFITKDMVELKKEWYEAELGELDDEDFEKYLGREVKTIDIEEDDETVNVRFDNHDSQWFPVTSLYQ